MENEKEEIKILVGEIDGWLQDAEGELLYDLAKNCQGKGVIVEVGSWKGRSTIWLAKGSQSGSKIRVYAVDPHTGLEEQRQRNEMVSTFEEFKKNISQAAVDGIVTVLLKNSVEAAKEFDFPVELIFIDATHVGDAPKIDFESWFSKVIEGGVMAFHDTLRYEDTAKMVEKYVYKSKYFKDAGLVETITFARKVKQNSVKDRIRNRYVLFIKNIYQIGYRLPLPKPIKSWGKKLVELIRLKTILMR